MNPVVEVCVDASLAIKVIVQEVDSSQARALFEKWSRDGARLIAPAFFEVETASILRQKVELRGELTAEQADAAFESLVSLPVDQLSVPGQNRRAWEIARRFHFPTVYDATYLALAELRGCEFWTADARLFDWVKDQLAFVRSLGDYIADAI